MICLPLLILLASPAAVIYVKPPYTIIRGANTNAILIIQSITAFMRSAKVPRLMGLSMVAVETVDPVSLLVVVGDVVWGVVVWGVVVWGVVVWGVVVWGVLPESLVGAKEL